MTEPIRDWLGGLPVSGRPDEYEAKRLLELSGIRVPRGLRLGAAEAAAPAIDSAAAFGPVFIVKACSSDLLHKTENRGVIPADAACLAAAVSELRGRFPGYGILIEEKIAYAGNEFIIGAFRDPTFGPSLMVGAGGILTELYQDVAFRLIPCPTAEALRMLKELRVFPVLEGFRGLKLDAAALAEAVARIGGAVLELGDRFEQLDVNPIVYDGRFWTALDAKLVLR
jgi:hypothetical protein